ncbi:MAG: hypothetical protein AAF547_08600 [Actinomycetota bacterium]
MGRPGSAVPGAGRLGRRTERFARWSTAAPLSLVAVVAVTVAVLGSACSAGVDRGAPTPDPDDVPAAIRSSGQLAFTDDGAPPVGGIDGPVPSGPGPTLGDELTDGQAGAGPLPDGETPVDGEVTQEGLDEVAPPRPDGIELVYADGALGPARLGTTIQQMVADLGPAYRSEPEPVIRPDFPSGHAVIKDDAVVFWAIEEDGVVTTVMTTSPLVGLEDGLRPTLPLVEAITLRGQPTLQRGTERREFVRFEDGTGGSDDLQVLVAVGRFGGPVGLYPVDATEPGAETEAFAPAEATIKELWFRLG